MLNLAQTLMFIDFRGVFQFVDVESRYIYILYDKIINIMLKSALRTNTFE